MEYAAKQVAGSSSTVMSVVTINGKNLAKYTHKNVVSYCLRIPDGTLTGLKAGGGPITSRDGTVYTDWAEFRETLKLIMEAEGGVPPTSPAQWVHASDHDMSANPNDNPDHYAVGDALNEFVTTRYNQEWWVSYNTVNLPRNVFGLEFQEKGDVLFSTVYESVRDAKLTGSYLTENWHGEWYDWGPRSYSRTVAVA